MVGGQHSWRAAIMTVVYGNDVPLHVVGLLRFVEENKP